MFHVERQAKQTRIAHHPPQITVSPSTYRMMKPRRIDGNESPPRGGGDSEQQQEQAMFHVEHLANPLTTWG